MAFNINAQVVLSGPKNLNKVTKNIQSGLKKAGNVKIQIDAKSLSSIKNLNSSLKNLSSNVKALDVSVGKTQASLNQLGKGFSNATSSSKAFATTQSAIQKQTSNANKALQTQTGLLSKFSGRLNNAVKSAAAFSLVSGPIFGVQRALSGAVKDAVAFQKEIVKISQVTGDSVNNLDSLTNTINRLSVNLGVNANELAETARIIAQTGRRGKELEEILDGLAKSTLAASFGNIQDTTEGVIAAFGQFNLKGKETEAILGGLNQVSKDFAVEAEDLVSVIRRAGGVFAQSAGQTKNTKDALFELNAIFTAVRSNTRESADTIAAGLRTIFSRIQRRGTIEFLKEFNIELTNLNGEFVGQFEAFRRLSDGLDRIIKQGDALTLSAIAEELGGIRQIGKLLPAIANFEDAQKALASAQKGAAAGLSGDVVKALDTVDARVNKVQASFNELIRTIFESPTFQSFTKTILSTSDALLKLGTSIINFLEPVLPILTAIGSFKLGGFIGRSFGSIAGGVGTAAAGATGQTSAKTAGNTQRTASNTLKILSAINTQTSILKSSDNTLRSINSNLLKLINVTTSLRSITGVSIAGGVGGAGRSGRRRRASGGIIPKFANGGRVYGPSHAAGGVIAELEGGEYVVPKGYKDGETIVGRAGRRADFESEARRTLRPEKSTAMGRRGTIAEKNGTKLFNAIKSAEVGLSDNADVFGGIFLRPGGASENLTGVISQKDLTDLSPAAKFILTAKKFQTPDIELNERLKSFQKKFNSTESDYALRIRSLSTQKSESLEAGLFDGVLSSIEKGTESIRDLIGQTENQPTINEAFLKQFNIDNIIGNLFEAVLNNAGSPFGGSDKDRANDNFDFPFGLAGTLNSIFGGGLARGKPPVDAKSTINTKNTGSLQDKVRAFYADIIEKDLKPFKSLAASELTEFLGTPSTKSSAVRGFKESKGRKPLKASGGFIQKFKDGGVPVRISNGELVITDPKEVAANKGTLQSINKLAAGGFASGRIAKGPGSGTSDSIYTTLPEGSFVVNAASTKAFLGGGFANGGVVQRFASGGDVDKLKSIRASAIRQQEIIKSKLESSKGDTSSRQQQIDNRLIGNFNKLERVVESLTREIDKATEAEARAAQQTRDSTNATTDAIEELGEELNTNELFGQFSGALTGLAFSVQGAAAAFDDGKVTFDELILIGTAASQALVALQAAAKLAAAAQSSGGIGGLTGAMGARFDKLGQSSIGKSITKGFKNLRKSGGFAGKAASQFGRTAASVGSAVGVQTTGGAIAAGAAFVVAAPIIGTVAGKIIGDATSNAINNAFGDIETAAGVTGIKGETSEQATTRGVVSGFAGGAVGGTLAGAGIGAAVGSIIPGIGTAIGAAAGAGIGAVIGASAGAIAGAINGPLEQAAFEAGIGLRESVESLSESFDALKKNINSVTLREFNDASREVSENFFNTVTALQDFTNNSVSARNAISGLFGGVETDSDVLANSGSLNAADFVASIGASVGSVFGVGGALAGQSVGAGFGGDAFKGFDQFFGTQIGRTEKGFKRLAESFNNAASELGDITQRIKESNEALQASISASFGKGIDLSAFDNIDLSAENTDGVIKTFNTSLKASAESGNIFAQRLQEQQQIFKQNQVTFRTAAFAQKAASDDISDASDVAAGRLGNFAVQVEQGKIDPLNQQQVDEFLDGSFGVFQGAARARAEAEIKQIQESIKKGEQAAIQQGVVNGLLKEAQSALNEFIAKTKESADELAFAAARTDVAFANAASDLNALSGGATSISARQQATGVGQGKAGLDARQAFLERGGTQLGVDTSNIQGLDAAFTNIDEVAKEALTGLKTLGDGATVTADQVSGALVSGLEERIGKKLPKNLEQSIGSGIKAFSRQLGNGANIPIEELEQAIEEGRLEEVLGPQAAAFQEQTNKVIEAMVKLEQSVAQLATLELEQLTITRKNNAEEVKRLAANKKAIKDINKNLVGKATEAVDIVEQARDNVNAEAAALSGIGISDPQELLNQRATAQSELDAFRRGEGTEGLSATERATEEARLTNQVNATTDALKLLANDTTQLAAIQEKLNQALQQRQQLESGVTGILDTAFQGPGALNQFGFEAASLAGTGALSGDSTDQFQFGQQSNAEIRQLINNLNDPRFAAAVDAQGRAAGEEGNRSERVRLQAVQQLGERFRSSQEFQNLDPAGQAIFEAELDGLLEVDKTIEQLSKEANDLLKIQNFILAELAKQDGENAQAIIAQAREAVAANEQVVKNEIRKLNEMSGTDEAVETTGQRAEQLAEKQLQVETALQLARQKQADLENQGFLGFGGASKDELDRNAAVIKSLEDDLGLIQEKRRGTQGQAQARLDTAQTKLKDFEASMAAGTTGKTSVEQQRTLERLRGDVEQAQFTAASLDGPLAAPVEIIDNSVQGQITQGIQDAFAPVTEDLERIFNDTFGGYISDFNETVSNVNAEFNEITESISSAFQGFTDATDGLVEGFTAIPESINLLGNISLLGAEGLAGGAVDGLKSFISSKLQALGLTSTAEAVSPGSIGNNQNLN